MTVVAQKACVRIKIWLSDVTFPNWIQRYIVKVLPKIVVISDYMVEKPRLP